MPDQPVKSYGAPLGPAAPAANPVARPQATQYTPEQLKQAYHEWMRLHMKAAHDAFAQHVASQQAPAAPAGGPSPLASGVKKLTDPTANIEAGIRAGGG